MRRKIFVVALIVLVCMAVLAACSKKPETVEGPPNVTEITDAQGLSNIRNFTGEENKDRKFILKNDIDLSSYNGGNWEPIGTNVQDAFWGSLDGNGFTIKNLSIKGVGDDGYPIFVGKGAQIEGVTAYSSIGLFGYTNSAVIKNLKLNVDISYYMDIDYGFAAGLIGYNIGASKIEDITVSGNINVSNIYRVKKNYNNAGEYQNLFDECPSTGYLGGVVAYSAGNSTFDNIISSVNINNMKYCAYWMNEDSVDPETAASEDFKEDYEITYGGASYQKPRQIFASGIASFMRGGIIKNADYSGQLTIAAKSVCASGVVGAAYSMRIQQSHANYAQITTYAIYKNVVGGIAGMLDKSSISDSTLMDPMLTANKLDGMVEAISVGGIFGYAYNLSTVENSTATKPKITTAYDKSLVGGIGGILRDAEVTNCQTVNASFYMSAAGVSEQHLEIFAITVSSVYGNSVLKDCKGYATNYIGTSSYKNNNAYHQTVDASYVEENGKPAARLYRQGSTRDYLTIYASVDATAKKLNVSVMDEELNVLSEAVYSLETVKSSHCAAKEYINVYFVEGEGFKAAEEGELKADGRDITQYQYRSGVPAIANLTVN